MVLNFKVFFLFRWDCNKDTSISGPAVLSMSIPSGYILDREEISRLSNSGHEVWVKDQTVVIFFQKVDLQTFNQIDKICYKSSQNIWRLFGLL